MTCTKCATPPVATLTVDYAAAEIWLDDRSDPSPAGYALCHDHAQRFAPPVGWIVTDRRAGSAQVVLSLDVA